MAGRMVPGYALDGEGAATSGAAAADSEGRWGGAAVAAHERTGTLMLNASLLPDADGLPSPPSASGKSVRFRLASLISRMTSVL